MSGVCLGSDWVLSQVCLHVVPPSHGCDNMVALSDNMAALSGNVVPVILHVNCPVCTVWFVFQMCVLVAHQCSLALCITRTCHIPWHPGHPKFGGAMAPKKAIKGKLKKGACTGNDIGNKDITKKGKAKDHDQDKQKGGAQGKGKGNGKDTVEDIESKSSKKDPKG